jgi:hypothetical protein
MNKIFYSIDINTDKNETLSIFPDNNGIIIHIRETKDGNLYLNKDEMEFFIFKMREMMNHVKQTNE